MRIINSQIIALEKIIIETNLTLDLFETTREDDVVRFQFKADYFSFQITKIGTDVFTVIYKSVSNKAEQGGDYTWVGTSKIFANWIYHIYSDVENGRQVYKPTPKPVQPTVANHIMSPTIIKISPKFDLIFNQAFEAEQYGLNEICGIGYRKAFEFLIKDYVLRGKVKEEKVLIKNMGINEVVKKYIIDTKINLIVHRAIWLGNDHAHYMPVFKNKTISDLKGLIYNTITWIETSEELRKLEKHAEKIAKSIPHKSSRKKQAVN